LLTDLPRLRTPFRRSGRELVAAPRGKISCVPDSDKRTDVIFTSLPVPADVEQVALGANGLIEGMRPDTAFFDMSTNSVAVVRKINAAFAEKNLYSRTFRRSRSPTASRSTMRSAR
jgi:3-hydroxyisobutyrate dehydrogenase